jgi:phage host-nuclease inhibitor protein Gam
VGYFCPPEQSRRLGGLVSRKVVKQVWSLEKATEALARAGELARQIREIDTRLERRTSKIKKAAMQKAGVLKKELDQLKKPLYDFYNANEHLLEGEKRTLTLASGSLSMRLGNWTVHLDKDVEEDPEHRLPTWAQRVTVTANREKLLEKPELAMNIVGVEIDRIDRLHLLPSGETTGFDGPSRTIRYEPKEAVKA